MLIDLTSPVLHVLVDECPLAVIVRTLGKDGEASYGRVAHHSVVKGKTNVTLVSPEAKIARGTSICYETRIPIERCLQSKTQVYAYFTTNELSEMQLADTRNASSSVETFEVSTLKRGIKQTLLWRAQIRVVRPKRDKWLVSVFKVDHESTEELAAFTSSEIEPYATGIVPLKRLDKATIDDDIPNTYAARLRDNF